MLGTDKAQSQGDNTGSLREKEAAYSSVTDPGIKKRKLTGQGSDRPRYKTAKLKGKKRGGGRRERWSQRGLCA